MLSIWVKYRYLDPECQILYFSFQEKQVPVPVLHLTKKLYKLFKYVVNTRINEFISCQQNFYVPVKH